MLVVGLTLVGGVLAQQAQARAVRAAVRFATASIGDELLITKNSLDAIKRLSAIQETEILDKMKKIEKLDAEILRLKQKLSRAGMDSIQ